MLDIAASGSRSLLSGPFVVILGHRAADPIRDPSTRTTLGSITQWIPGAGPWDDEIRDTGVRRSRYFFHTHQTPCHHSSTPVTGWAGNVPVQAGGRPPGVCRNVRRDEGGGRCTGGFRWQQDQPERVTPNGLTGQASHRRDPCPLCRPAPAGSQGGGGNGPVAGRLADAGRVSDPRSGVLAFPDRQRKAKPVPDEAGCRFEQPVSGQ
jgi:hypothetical protein